MDSTAGGRILTFYSYKGGTGRTMALANVAWILASRGKRVLALDWDLEAPGLHRYFAPLLSDATLSSTDGLMEFLGEYIVAATKEAPAGTKPDERWYEPYADLKRYAEPIQWRFADGGSVEIVGAGRQNASYGARVNGFDWDGFYRRFGGGAFLDGMIRQLKTAYDYVLVDSRTGISDTSGICTIHLPDALVVLYTLNNQSIEGASNVAAHVADARARRSSEPFPIFSMATRVELGEKKKLEARRLLARERFAPFLESLSRLSAEQRKNYWGEMEVLYDPYYAYEEVLATIADLPDRTNSVLAAFERLTARLTDGEVSRAGELSPARRQEALELYAADAGSTGSPRTLATVREPAQWDVFISASNLDQEQADRLYYLLGANQKVFYAPRSIPAGADWRSVMAQALQHSGAMVVLFSERTAEDRSKTWVSEELEAALARSERDPSFKLIPVQLDPRARPPLEYLTRYQWLTASGGDIQPIALAIRDALLGNAKPEASDQDRIARLQGELDRALSDKAQLTERAQQLQQQLTTLSGEQGVLNERLRASEHKRRRDVTRDVLVLTSAGVAIVFALFQPSVLCPLLPSGMLPAVCVPSVQR